MSLSMHAFSVAPFLRGFAVLSAVLDKAEAFAETKKISTDVLVIARLAPDMLSLVGQRRPSKTSAIASG